MSRLENIPAVRCAAIAAMWLAGAPAARAIEDAPPPLLVAIVGDSTVATYDAASPVHGWGEFIQRRMRPRVLVHNFAAGGASTSSFLAEGRWDAALADKPSVVLIQFGHNDSAQAASLGRFEANLERFVESARACGATPILVTPVQLRVFRDGKFVPSLQAYADAMRQLAARAGVVVIDLNQLSGQLFVRLGPLKTAQLASTGSDGTHFNRLGAQAMAEIVLRELSLARTPLAREIIAAPAPAPVTTTPKPSKLRRAN